MLINSEDFARLMFLDDTDVGGDGDPNAAITDDAGDVSSQDTDDTTDDAGGFGADDFGDDLPEEQVLKSLAKQGINVEKLSQLKGIVSGYAPLNKKHQTLLNESKQATAALQALMQHPDGKRILSEIQSGRRPQQDFSDVPKNLANLGWDKEKFGTLAPAVNHIAQQLIVDAMPDIIDAVMDKLDWDGFAKEHDNFGDFEDSIRNKAQSLGIRRLNREALEMIYGNLTQSVKKSVGDLANNGRNKVLGKIPPPGGGSRTTTSPGAPITDKDWEAKLARQRAKAGRAA
jgi:hypothetical protein